MEVHFQHYVRATIHEISSILLFSSLLASGLIICCPPRCYYRFDVRLQSLIFLTTFKRAASESRTKENAKEGTRGKNVKKKGEKYTVEAEGRIRFDNKHVA